MLAVLEREKVRIETLVSEFTRAQHPERQRLAETQISVFTMPEVVETREAFVNTQAEKTRRWKQQVAEKQQAKQAMKQVLLPKAPPAVPVINMPDPAIENHWRDVLQKLNDHYFEVLSGVLSLKGKVTYTDIYHLITNHLSGSIEEYGSSHKRIRIAAYCAELTGDDLASKENHASSPPKLSKATVAYGSHIKHRIGICSISTWNRWRLRS